MGEALILGLVVVAIVLSVISLVFSLVNFTDNKALHKSTHQIQYVDPQVMATTLRDEQGFEVVSDKLKDKIKEEDDDLFGDETVHTHMKYN